MSIKHYKNDDVTVNCIMLMTELKMFTPVLHIAMYCHYQLS